MSRLILFAILFLLASCGGQPASMPVADRGPGGLHPVPDAQAFSPGPVEVPPRSVLVSTSEASTSPQVGEEPSPGAPTPEPSTLVLLAAGLAVLGLGRRKRRP